MKGPKGVLIFFKHWVCENEKQKGEGLISTRKCLFNLDKFETIRENSYQDNSFLIFLIASWKALYLFEYNMNLGGN